MKRSLLALVLLAALPFAAAADQMSYSYAEAGWMKTDTGGDADGWAVNGSWAFHPNFHVFGGYTDQNVDEVFGADFDQWQLGVGYNTALNQNVDFVSRVAYRKASFGYSDTFLAIFPHSESSASGYTIEAGVRAAPNAMLEAEVAAGYGDLDYNNGEFYLKLGGQLKFGAGWGLVGDVKFVSGDTQYFLGPRMSW
jgi:Ax21 family sulfation-dependent quorum factor